MVLPVRSRAALLKFRAGDHHLREARRGRARRPAPQLGSVAELEREEPALDRAEWRFACAYREYLTDDARLVLANLRAAAGCGATALNWAPVTGIPIEHDRAVGVAARCRLTGRELRVRAACVVNAAGAWVEALRRLEDPAAPPLLHLSKGVHIGIPAARLPVRNLLLLATDDRRSIFALRRDEIVFVGTTDTTYTRGRGPVAAGRRAPTSSTCWRRCARYFGGRQARARRRAHRLGGPAAAGRRARQAAARDLAQGRDPDRPRGRGHDRGRQAHRLPADGARALERVAQALGRALAATRAKAPPLPGGDFAGDLERARARARARAPRSTRAAAMRLARLYGSEADEVAALGASRSRRAHRCSRARSTGPSRARAPPPSRTCSTGARARRSTKPTRARRSPRRSRRAWRRCSAGARRRRDGRARARARAARRGSRLRGRASDERLVERLRAALGARVHTDAGDARRAPARHLGAGASCTTWSGAARRRRSRSCGPASADEVATVLRLCRDGARAGDPVRRRLGRVRRRRGAARRGRALDARARRAGLARRARPDARRFRAGTIGGEAERARRRARGSRSVTGRSRSSSRRSAAGSRRARRASSRPRTARSRTSCSRSRSCCPTAAWCARARRRAPPRAPTCASSSSAARARSAW